MILCWDVTTKAICWIQSVIVDLMPPLSIHANCRFDENPKLESGDVFFVRVVINFPRLGSLVNEKSILDVAAYFDGT